MGPTWVLSSPGGLHVGPVNLDIWVGKLTKALVRKISEIVMFSFLLLFTEIAILPDCESSAVLIIIMRTIRLKVCVPLTIVIEWGPKHIRQSHKFSICFIPPHVRESIVVPQTWFKPWLISIFHGLCKIGQAWSFLIVICYMVLHIIQKQIWMRCEILNKWEQQHPSGWMNRAMDKQRDGWADEWYIKEWQYVLVSISAHSKISFTTALPVSKFILS